jgi:hypothetical protein
MYLGSIVISYNPCAVADVIKPSMYDNEPVAVFDDVLAAEPDCILYLFLF